MNANSPVTNNEREMGDLETLVFSADFNGVITYADRAFIRASGFHEGELYGKSHNIVRHPDMPQAVFMDMQETVISGRTWEGIVKNRCRNGNFYWVHATVSPVRAGRKITGYKSVCRKPTQPQIGEACRLYQQINEGKETVLWLSSLADSPGKRRFLSNSIFNPRVVFFLTFLSLLLICAGAAGLHEAAQRHHASMHNLSIGSIIAGLLVTAWLGFQMIRAVMRPGKKIIRPVAAMASSETDSKVAASKDGADSLQQPLKGKGCGLAEPPGNASTISCGDGGGGRAGDGLHQFEKQAAKSWKAPPGMKEQSFAMKQNTESAKQMRQVVRNPDDISIRDKRAVGGGVLADDEAGRTVEEIVVAVKRVANIMAEISVVPAGHGKAGMNTGNPAEFAGRHKTVTPSTKAAAKAKPLRAVKDEDDEWKDF